jgi:hypothetical protein
VAGTCGQNKLNKVAKKYVESKPECIKELEGPNEMTGRFRI